MERITSPEADFIMDVVTQIGEPIAAGSGTIDAGEVTLELGTELAEAAKARLVAVDPMAPSCCIDGRCAKCTMATGETAMELEPRPSVAGGGDITAYAAAELAGYFGTHDIRPSGEKLADVDNKLRSQNIFSGSHGDEAAAANEFRNPDNPEQSKTGCGAADRLPEIMMQFYEQPETIAQFTSILLGDTYNASNMILPDKEMTTSNIRKWDSHDVIEVTGKVSEGKNVEILQGSHKELAVIFNFVENTTVDRDALVKETGKQAFVVDMWYIDKLAHGLAAGRPDAEDMYATLKHLMVGYQIATYLTLCNGTQRPIVLSRKDVELSA